MAIEDSFSVIVIGEDALGAYAAQNPFCAFADTGLRTPDGERIVVRTSTLPADDYATDGAHERAEQYASWVGAA